MLLRLTAEGAKNTGTVTSELDNLTTAIGAVGGSVDAAVVTLGGYDAVVVGTIDSDEKLAWLAAEAASCGLVGYETLRGFSPEEWGAALGGIEYHPAHPFHK